MMQYNFTLKDNNRRVYNLFMWFLFFLHVVAAAWIALRTPDKNIKGSMDVLLITYGLLCVGYFFFRRKAEVLEAFNLLLSALYVHFWFTQVGLLACLIFVLIFLFANAVKRKKTTISFSEAGVNLTSVYKTVSYPWVKMDNVILKDNLLTVDFKTNKLLQTEIAAGNEAVDEKIFNVFCSEQLMQQV